MESNIREPEYFSNDALSEPHFEEEATIASARPVVPLEEIRAETNSKRRLALGLSVLVSLALGALGATFIYKLRNNKPASAIVEAAVSGAAAKSQDVVEEAPPVQEPTGGLAAEAARPAEIEIERETIPAAAKPNRVQAKRQTAPVPQIDDEEMRREERIEARRMRRRAERQAEREARRDRKRGDDLLRIREIFEGSRRP